MAAQDLAKEFKHRQPFVYQIHGKYVSINNGEYYQSKDDEIELYLEYREAIKFLHGREYNEIKRTAEFERLMKIFETLKDKVEKKHGDKNIALNNLTFLLAKCNEDELVDVNIQWKLFQEASEFNRKIWEEKQNKFYTDKLK